MNTFEITLQRRLDAGWPVVVESSAGDGSLPLRGEGTLALDPVALLAQEADPRAYGTALGEALFRGTVRDAFVAARARGEAELRVLLNVEAADLKTLRWERLCAPLDNEWRFLALDQRVPFSLYLPSLTDQRFPPFGRRDLRALVLVASPEGLADAGLAPFDSGATIAAIRAALGEIPVDVLASGEGTAGPPTLDALCERITAQAYTLLHLVCHGRLLREGPHAGETVLYLAGPDGRVAPVGATELIARLGSLGGARGLPHLAFLCACESASAGAEAEGALGGLAQRLVRELGMPAVVAMSDRVSIATAEALSSVFYRRLREHGEVDRALVEASAGLAGRADATVPALYSRLGGRPLFSDSLERPLTAAEIGDGLDRLEALLPERAPVLAPRLAALATVLRGSTADPAALSPEARIAREEALKAVAELCLQVTDLAFPALALGKTPPPYDGRQPFRGLSPFGPADREFFFGREALVARLAGRLGKYPFLAVLGPSGSGKSSLVLAGLLPALGSEFAVFSPGADPVAQLEAALAAASAAALVVVDQFEELFTLCPDEAQRAAFTTQLLALVPGRRVVLTMRADFWGECAPYPALREAMQAHQELIAPMDPSELRRAMELGAAAVGLRFEADLSTTLLDEVAGEPGAMPLLGQALLELWKRRHGHWLLTSEYRAIGGVREAIAHTADELYESLPAPERERVRDIFVRLTRLDEADVATGLHRDTRRRVGAAELVPAGAEPGPTRALLARLADARLVVTSVNPVTGGEEVEVVHEALIRYWPRLRTWLDEGRASLRLREAIRAAALEWGASGRSEALLVHRAGRLEDAVRLSHEPRYALNATEQAYLEAATALQNREQQRELEQVRALAEEQRQRAEAETRARSTAERATRRQRYFSLGLAVLLLASIATAGYAVVQQRAADEQRQAAESAKALAEQRLAEADAAKAAAEAAEALAKEERQAADAAQVTAESAQQKAEIQAQVARSRQLAAQSSDELDKHFDLALLLGVEAFSAANGLDPITSFEARDALLTGRLSHPRLESFLTGPTDVRSIAISPDGAKLASGGYDGTIILWDLPSRQALGAPLTGHRGPVNSVAFSPDGTVLASGSDDKTVILWDMASGKPLGAPLTGHTDVVRSVAFSPDGKTLATGSWDRSVILWDVASRAPLAGPLVGHKKSVRSVAFSPDGKTLASGSDDNTVILWDVASRQPSGDLFAAHQAPVNSVAFSPDGKTLASGSDDETVILWDVASRKPVGPPLTGHTEVIRSVAFSPDGKILASGSWDGMVILWDVASRQPLGGPLTGHTDVVRSVTFSPDGQILASGGYDGAIILWDVSGRQPLEDPFVGYTDVVYGASFNPDGTMLATGSDGNAVILWDVAERQPVGPPLMGHTDVVRSVAFSPDGETLASGSDDGTVILWDVAERQLLGPPLMGHTDVVRSVAFSPDGETLASGSDDGTIILWDVASRQPLGPPLAGHGGPVNGVTFSPDGGTLAAANKDHTVILWSPSSRQPLGSRLIGHRGPVRSVAFSPDGRTLASGSDDNTVILWDVATRGPIGAPLIGHSRPVNTVAFSPDGTLLASGSDDNTVILWDVPSRQALGAPLSWQAAPVYSVTFSPRQQLLASGVFFGVILWDVDQTSWRERDCGRANRNFSPTEWNRYFPGEQYRLTCPDLAPGEDRPGVTAGGRG